MSERKYYTTRIEIEKHRKKGEIVFYRKPCVGGYYLVKPERRTVSKELEFKEKMEKAVKSILLRSKKDFAKWKVKK